MPTLTPAYGRDYKSKKEVEHALTAGHDFILNDIMSPYDGKPCSARDFAGQSITVRWSGMRKVAVIKIPE